RRSLLRRIANTRALGGELCRDQEPEGEQRRTQGDLPARPGADPLQRHASRPSPLGFRPIRRRTRHRTATATTTSPAPASARAPGWPSPRVLFAVAGVPTGDADEAAPPPDPFDPVVGNAAPV